MNPLSALLDPCTEAETFTVFGLGWTGVAACRLLTRLGKRVIATDTRDRETLQAALDKLHHGRGIALPRTVEVRAGEAHRDHGCDAVVLTQSVKHHEAPVEAALRRGVEVIPEIDLAARAINTDLLDLVCIGGTDGKTTTTKLAHHIVSHQRRAYVGGNSWPPLSQALLEAADDLSANPLPAGARAALIAEVSAFQLPPWHRLSPLSAAVTNVAEDHVDEYFQGSMDAYVAAKRGPTDHLGPGQSAALNIDDPIVRTWQAGIEARGANVVRTTLAARAVGDHASAAYQHNGELRLRWRGTEQGLISARDLPMVGDHNVENVLSAMGALLPLELELAPATEALRSFSAPGHRLEYVARIDGVDVYDDSKATNVHAALAGLAAFGGRPLVAIVGGVDKGLDLNQWVEALRARTRAVIVIGELRERLFRDHADHLPQASCADSLEEAVKMALDASKTGDVLVLSPACSSFDMFSSYAQRGERFQEIIKGKAG